MKTKNTILRFIAFVLVILLVVGQPIVVNADLINSSFNIDYVGENGATIMKLTYSNASVTPSFSKLADRALTLKNGQYSYSAAIQILTETKSVVSKVTSTDYKNYQNAYLKDMEMNGMMAYKYTYESFIMRNVLYTMLIRKASYTEMNKAIQIIYDTAVIQSQNKAFRSDALMVLADVNLLASFATDEDTAAMLFYVSNFTKGTNAGYNGSKIPSVNIAQKYEQYLKDEYDRTHGDGTPVGGENSDGNDSSFFPGGAGNQGGIELPPIIDTVIPDDGTVGEDGFIMEDTFHSDLTDLYNGTVVYKYTLCYTLDKSAETPKYYQTKITVNQFVTYDNIISVIKSASRNSDLVHVEDSNAVLLVYGGVCSVLEKNDVLYDNDTLSQLFSNLPDFGLALVLSDTLSAS